MLFDFIVFLLVAGIPLTAPYPKKSTTSKRSMSQQKLKILCLHGLGQNNLIFRNKTGSTRKRLKSLADLTYIDAPYITDISHSNLEDLSQTEEQRSWFHPQDDRFSPNIVTGFNESFNYMIEAVKSKGPFDGILGFSQGAELLGLICCLKSKNLFQAEFKFAILVSGFKSHCPAYSSYYDLKSPINIPSLHIWGDTDQIIVKERSEALFNLFDAAVSQKIVHPGGHFLPGHSDVAAGIKKFLQHLPVTTVPTDQQ